MIKANISLATVYLSVFNKIKGSEALVKLISLPVPLGERTLRLTKYMKALPTAVSLICHIKEKDGLVMIRNLLVRLAL